MAADIIQSKYDQLEQIASKFAQQADNVTDLKSQVQQRFQALVNGGWQGKGQAAFSQEMESDLFPAVDRLTNVFHQAQSVTLQIREILKQAEQEASGPFRGQGGALQGGSGNGATGGAGGGSGSGAGGGAGAGTFNEGKFWGLSALKAGFQLFKDRNAWKGFFGGVRFVKDANGMWRLFGSRAAKEAMGVSPFLNRFGKAAIQESMDNGSFVSGLKGLVTGVRNGQFGSAAKSLLGKLTTAPALTPAATFAQRIKGPAILSSLISAGTNIYDYGWGSHKDMGLGSRQFITSTAADVSAGLGIVGVSTAIGTLIPIPGVGTAVGFAAGVGLQYAYDKWGKEAWHSVVDGAGQKLQDFGSSVASHVSDFGNKVSNTFNDAKDAVGKVFSPLGGLFN